MKTAPGQSLTEVALVLPIVLLIIAGLVEVSNLIISQSRVDTGVRSAVRFGAQGGADEGIRLTLLQSVTPTLDLDPERWDVYLIRATVDAGGTAFVSGTWRLEPLFGLQATRPITTLNQAGIQAEVLDNLQQEGSSTATSSQSIVGIMAFHNVSSVLGLEMILGRLNRVRSFAVMRAAATATAMQTNGCGVFPLAVEVGSRSLNGSGEFPDYATFEYPVDDDDKPQLANYFSGGALPAPASMLAAPARALFMLPFNGVTAADLTPDAATFDFARWDWGTFLSMDDALQASLAWPGNSDAPCDDAGAGDPGWEHPVLGCSLDDQLHVADPVRVSTAGIAASLDNDIKDELAEHVERGRALRVFLFDAAAPPPPLTALGLAGDDMRKVSHFAIVRPLGFNLRPGDTNWLLVEFLGLDSSCGIQTAN